MSTEAPLAAVAAPPKRRRTPRLIAILVAVAAGGWGGWGVLHRGQESTDDAAVEGRVTQIAAREPGQVTRVAVFDNQVVAAGDVLVELDPSDYQARAAAAAADFEAARAAADAARASLAITEHTAPAALVQAEGGVTSALSSQRSARASIDQAHADIDAAEAHRGLAAITLRRANALVAQTAIPQAELDQRQAEFDAATAQLAEARARVAAAEASVTGSSGGVVLATGRLAAAKTTAEQVASARAAVALADARVLQAAAAKQLADLAVGYTTVRAPHAGLVSRRVVEAGQIVSPDRPLMALVANDDLWIVANFKEDQMANMRPGQRADLRFDTFGRRDFSGHVASIAGATGARFALLPPDNATGNFVKVVQRVPVLIRLDGTSGVALRPGASADVTVHTDEP